MAVNLNRRKGNETMKTTFRFDWENGYTKCRRLSRSFDTLEEAKHFSTGKQNADIYKSKGRYKVEWIMVTDNNVYRKERT